MKYYLILITYFLLGHSLYAQWGNTPAENLKLSEEQGVKLNKMALAGPDGSWYICYTNLVVNTQSLHLTRLDETGQVLWAKTIKEGEAPGSLSAVMVSDSLGGVILAWTDRRTENTAFTYANRIDAEGNKLWGEADVRVGVSEIEEFLTKMVSDGKNGAIITLYDDNPPSGDFRGIYAYRVRANGQVAWRTYLFPSGTNSHDYGIDQDAEGGLVAVTEYGHPIELENQIRAMRLDSTGAKIWPDEKFVIGPISQPIGMKVRSSTRSHNHPRILVNPGLGFYVLYFENPGILFPEEEINHRAHFLEADGSQGWAPEGLALNRPASTSPDIQMKLDHEGNLYFNYHTDSAFHLQKVTPTGTLPWSMEGVPYTSAFQGAPDNILITSCNDIIIGVDGGPEEIIEAIRVSPTGQLVYSPDASIDLSTSIVGGHDRDPITAINAADEVVAVWSRDEDVNDTHMDVYVQGFGKDGVLGNEINATRDIITDALDVFPNPFSQQLQIVPPETKATSRIYVYNQSGQQVFQGRLNQLNTSIETKTWAPGLYLVLLHTEKAVYRQKVVKTTP